jgi:hypothetical protein
MKRFKKMHVKWLDSAIRAPGWELRRKTTPIPPVPCETVGFVVDETKKYITLALSINPVQVWARTTIPKCCITKMKRLK